MSKRLVLGLVSTITLVAGLLVGSSPAQAVTRTIPDNSVCGLPGVIVGTDGDDTITGTAGDDVICGLGGNDVINGAGGDDIIIGGSGADNISGGDGNDTLSGEIGDDYIDGQAGADSEFGGDGADSTLGGPGDDYISGGPGADNLFGNEGRDQLLAGAGNDSLNGGPGADLLNGEGGSDTCEKQRTDTTVSCYYDKAGPKLVNIAIADEDASLDSSDPNRYLHIRFTIADPGTGLLFANLDLVDENSFKILKKHPDAGIPQGQSSINVAINSGWIRDCSGSGTSDAVCRYAGTATLGVYKATIVLPRNLKTAKYYVSSFDATDVARNRTLLKASDLVKRKLAVSFVQTGKNDRSAPQITSFNILGDRVLSSSSDSVVAEVSFVDPGGHGLNRLALKFNILAANSWLELEAQNIGPFASVNPAEIAAVSCPPGTLPSSSLTCVDPIGACPVDLETIGNACLVNGDASAGTVRVRVRQGSGPMNAPRSLLKLLSITAYDSFSNVGTRSRLAKTVVAQNVVSKSFGMARDNDRTPPNLVSISASRTSIDTGSQPQSVVFAFRLKDAGKGVDDRFTQLSVMKPSTCAGLPSGSCGYESVDICRTVLKKTTSKGSDFLTTCTFPAHFAAGRYMINVSAVDASYNSNMRLFAGNDLRVFGVPGFITNG